MKYVLFLMIYSAVFGASVCLFSENPILAVAEVSDSPSSNTAGPGDVVKQYISYAIKGQVQNARKLILEPDKPYNPEVAEQIRATAQKPTVGKEKGDERDFGVIIPLRRDWLAYIQGRNFVFKRIEVQKIQDDVAEISVDLGFLNSPEYSELAVFSLRKKKDRWLILDINFTGELRRERKTSDVNKMQASF